jgi:hypothetical protein
MSALLATVTSSVLIAALPVTLLQDPGSADFITAANWAAVPTDTA